MDPQKDVNWAASKVVLLARKLAYLTAALTVVYLKAGLSRWRNGWLNGWSLSWATRRLF